MLTQSLFFLLEWLGLWSGLVLPEWFNLLGFVAVLLLFMRYGFGLVSRVFERQADGNALRRLGADAFAQAITKVALYNRIPMEKDNWHHYGIAQRIEHARRSGQAGHRLERHDRRVRRLKWLLLGLLAIGLAGEVAFSQGNVLAYLDGKLLEGRQEVTMAHLPPLLRLAERAVRNDRHADAERFFRLILKLVPDDRGIRNNLAWVLVTQPGAEPETLREGLALARQAAVGSEAAYIWDTLAESHFRLGQWDAARAAAERALHLARAGKGRGNAALRYYEEQLARIGQQPPGGPGRPDP